MHTVAVLPTVKCVIYATLVSFSTHKCVIYTTLVSFTTHLPDWYAGCKTFEQRALTKGFENETLPMVRKQRWGTARSARSSEMVSVPILWRTIQPDYEKERSITWQSYQPTGKSSSDWNGKTNAKTGFSSGKGILLRCAPIMSCCESAT